MQELQEKHIQVFDVDKIDSDRLFKYIDYVIPAVGDMIWLGEQPYSVQFRAFIVGTEHVRLLCKKEVHYWANQEDQDDTQATP